MGANLNPLSMTSWWLLFQCYQLWLPFEAASFPTLCFVTAASGVVATDVKRNHPYKGSCTRRWGHMVSSHRRTHPTIRRLLCCSIFFMRYLFARQRCSEDRKVPRMSLLRCRLLLQSLSAAMSALRAMRLERHGKAWRRGWLMSPITSIRWLGGTTQQPWWWSPTRRRCCSSEPSMLAAGC